METLLVIIIIAIVLDLILTIRVPDTTKNIISIYFGVPGSGKTTFAAALTKKALKKKIDVYSNVPIIGSKELNVKSDLGTYLVHNGKIIIDEAGIDINNRDTKGFTKDMIKFFKLHRHYKTSIDVFSQSYNDMDITVRRLAVRLFVVKKSLFPYFIVCRKIRQKIDIDELSHEPTDMYYWSLPVVGTYRIFMPTLWKMFDSYEAPPLPEKGWSFYGSTSRYDEGDEEK